MTTKKKNKVGRPKGLPNLIARVRGKTVFARRLQELLAIQGLSYTTVADCLDLSASCISNWGTGDTKPSGNNLRRLCELFDVRPEFFIRDVKAKSEETVDDVKTSTSLEQNKNGTVKAYDVVGSAPVGNIVCTNCNDDKPGLYHKDGALWRGNRPHVCNVGDAPKRRRVAPSPEFAKKLRSLGASRRDPTTDPRCQRLRDALDARQWTYHRAATECGTSKSTMSRWCRDRMPVGDYLKKVMAVFNLNADMVRLQDLPGRVDVGVGRIDSPAYYRSPIEHDADGVPVPPAAPIITDAIGQAIEEIGADAHKAKVDAAVALVRAGFSLAKAAETLGIAQSALMARGVKCEHCDGLGVTL